MDKFKTYWPFGVAMIAFFMLGAYTDSVVNGFKEVPTYKFIINLFFGMLFLIKGINRVKEL